MDAGFGDDIGVQSIAEVDGVDIIAMQHRISEVFVQAKTGDAPFQIAVHYREEYLEKEVDGVYEYREEVQPCFARHHRK